MDLSSAREQLPDWVAWCGVRARRLEGREAISECGFLMNYREVQDISSYYVSVLLGSSNLPINPPSFDALPIKFGVCWVGVGTKGLSSRNPAIIVMGLHLFAPHLCR